MVTAPEPNGASQTSTPYIAEHPGVCGGYPVIERMRFPVRLVVEAYRRVGTIDKVVELYPQLTRAQVQCALDYYATSPGRVDEDIRRNAIEAHGYVETRDRSWPV